MIANTICMNPVEECQLRFINWWSNNQNMSFTDAKLITFEVTVKNDEELVTAKGHVIQKGVIGINKIVAGISQKYNTNGVTITGIYDTHFDDEFEKEQIAAAEAAKAADVDGGEGSADSKLEEND